MQEEIDQLKREIERLRSVDRGKSEFIYMTAHQLRTPLSAIKWTFHMIMNGELGPVTSDQRSFLEKGYENSEKVIATVNEWLNMDYLQTNKNKYQFVPVDICKLVDGVVAEFNERAREKKIDLITRRPDNELPATEVDPVKFSMVVENLIDNAIKYTPSGGQVTVTTSGDEVGGLGPAVKVVVADTGIGVPKAEQGRLFQQFFRSSNAVALTTQGSGLGLYIIKNLVEGHHGDIRFESEEGKGTQFTVTIPIKQKRV